MFDFEENSRCRFLLVVITPSLAVYACGCMTVRACVLPVCINICPQVDSVNFKKFTYIENSIFKIQWRKSPFLLLHFHFQGQSFCILLDLRKSHKWWEIEQILLLQSDRKSDICQRVTSLQMLYIRTLTYIFKVMNFEIWISRKQWASEKCSSTTFIHWYLPSNGGTIANVLCLDLDLKFDSYTF